MMMCSKKNEEVYMQQEKAVMIAIKVQIIKLILCKVALTKYGR